MGSLEKLRVTDTESRILSARVWAMGGGISI